MCPKIKWSLAFQKQERSTGDQTADACCQRPCLQRGGHPPAAPREAGAQQKRAASRLGSPPVLCCSLPSSCLPSAGSLGPRGSAGPQQICKSSGVSCFTLDRVLAHLPVVFPSLFRACSSGKP